MNYIVFQCYGYERVFHECAYALLSLSRVYANGVPANTEIWIYTDKPEWFKTFKGCNLPLNYREIDQATIKQWRGKIEFVHRVKIELLRDITNARPGNILYADTDIVFQQPVDKMLAGIAAGNRYMHIMEGIISGEANPIFKKLNNHLASKGAQLHGKPLNEMAMWNAGVLGFSPADNKLLENVLEFTDHEYPLFPKHIIEQFAFSVYFGDDHNIKAASPYMLHYWNLKEAGIILSSFFNHFRDRSWAELSGLSNLIQIPALMQEKINFYEGRSVAGKLQKKKWSPAIPDWRTMEKQL